MNKFPQSVRVWYYIEVRDDAGLWGRLKGSLGDSVSTQRIIEKPNTIFGINFGTYNTFSEHDVPNARRSILDKAKEIEHLDKYQDIRIICSIFDDAGYGDEYKGVIWKNGNWID